MQLSKNKRDKKIYDRNYAFVVSSIDKKQQALVAHGIRPIAVKRWAWAQARVVEEKDE